jgi:hypothetical protein
VLTTLVSVSPTMRASMPMKVITRALKDLPANAGARPDRHDPCRWAPPARDGTPLHRQAGNWIDNQVDARSGTVRVRVCSTTRRRAHPRQFARIRMGQSATARPW